MYHAVSRPIAFGRSLAMLSFLLAIVLFVPSGASAQSVSASRVAEVHAAAMPLDAHVDVLLPTTPEIYRTDDGISQVTVDKLVEGGMATVTMALQAPTGPDTPEGVAAARAEINRKLQHIEELAGANRDRVEIARRSSDIERIHADGKIAILLGFQNAYGLGTDVGAVADYVARGVRVFAFNHAGNNAFADSSRPQVPGAEPNGGLSALGREAVGILNRGGVVIDVSQLTPKGVFQTLELSKAPVIASHSGMRSLVDETRNLTDAELDAIAAADGVVCIPPFNTYIAPRPPDFVARLEALRREYGLPPEFRGVLDNAERLNGPKRGVFTEEALGTVPRATIEDYLDQIEYAVARIGVDHVGIGTDFDHGSGIIGYKDASEARNLTRGLLERGYSAADIAKIWSGNFMRVMRAAEAAAGR